MKKLNVGDIAIIDFARTNLNSSAPKKVEVLEVTETTYLLLDLDFNKGRDFVVDTNAFDEKSIEQIIEDFKNTKPTFVQRELVEPRIEVLAAKFRITKEKFEDTYKVIEMISTKESRVKEHMEIFMQMNQSKKD